MRKLYVVASFVTLCCYGREITPQRPVKAINTAFKTHQIVMLGGTDGSVPEHRILLNLIRSSWFSKSSNDIAVGCNSSYQSLVDQYLAGGNIATDQLQQVWRNSLAIGPVPDQPFQELFTAVREVNRQLTAGRGKVRIVCTDGPVNWEQVHSRADLNPFVPNRDEIFIRIVEEQILARHHKALLYAGALHFRRADGRPSMIERGLQEAGATTYVVLAGSNIIGSYEDRDKRFLQWRWPWMMPVQRTWLSQMPAKPLLMGGSASNAHIAGTLAKTGDAFLFLGPPNEVQAYVPKRSALERTAYGKETARRLRIIFGERTKASGLFA